MLQSTRRMAKRGTTMMLQHLKTTIIFIHHWALQAMHCIVSIPCSLLIMVAEFCLKQQKSWAGWLLSRFMKTTQHCDGGGSAAASARDVKLNVFVLSDVYICIDGIYSCLWTDLLVSQWRQREFKVGGRSAEEVGRGRGVPLPPGNGFWERGKFFALWSRNGIFRWSLRC